MSEHDEPAAVSPTATPGPTPTETTRSTSSGTELPESSSTTPDSPADAAPLPEAEPTPPTREKVDWGQRVLDHKAKVMAGMVLALLLGLGSWYWSVAQQIQQAGPGSAISTDQIDQLTAAPTPPEAAEPQTAMEQTLTQEQNHQTVEEATPEQLLAAGQPGQPAELTPAEKAEYRAKIAQAARANNTDTVLVTRRDPGTGQYSPQRVARPRVSFSSSPSRAQPFAAARPGTSGFATAANAAGVVRPTRDKDGFPFETNDEINLMLANLPEGVKATYEKMSGKRYRPLLAGQQSPAKDQRAAMQYIPGLDGFNTVKYRGANANPAEDLESALTPDVFYRCTIQGTQQVRTGSVVMLRLAEDATFGGVTFPRNMIFAAVASVESNRVSLQIDRLGPHKVAVEVYNYAYLPGIMIDPGKRAKASTSNPGMAAAMQQSSTQELSNAIAQSQQAANSWQGIGGRMAVTMLGRLPRAGEKLREVTLPDGYPILVTRAQTGQRGGMGFSQGGAGTSTGLMGQDGNPLQSLMMQGVGQGGYPAQPGYTNLPPSYYPATIPAGAVPAGVR